MDTSRGSVTVLRGSTFLVTDRTGDALPAPGSRAGLFYRDTRHLSQWELRLDGRTLESLGETAAGTSGTEALFVCTERTPGVGADPHWQVIRHRRIGHELRESLEVANFGTEPEEATLTLLFDADFADLFDVKGQLRFFPDVQPQDAVPAAGAPWFMALFGRDALLTSYLALPYLSALARSTLITLAARQADAVDDFRDAEPGKILHELRHGAAARSGEVPQSPYYGSADSTALFLIVLDEYHRWTGADDLVRRLEEPARAAIAWLERYADSNGDAPWTVAACRSRR